MDFASGEISKDGHTHRLQDQPLQILDELCSHAGEVVTRETLIARLWPKGVVEFDTGLNTAIRKLRNALGDDADTPRYIETLPRKGYRFIAHLEPPAPAIPLGAGAGSLASTVDLGPKTGRRATDPGPNAGRRASDRRAPLNRLALGLGSILLAVVLGVVAWNMPGRLFQATSDSEKLPTIVVLPLVDMTAQQNEQALCDGLTEELSNWLAHIPTLRVVARTSAFAFKGKNTDVREIGRQLEATHVLEGSLRRSGDQLRITTQLIEATNGQHIWSKTFDLPLGNIFQIEDTVSRSVAEELHLQLSAETPQHWAQRQPEKMEAYELYLLGRARQRERTAEDNPKAAEYFRRSIDADPQYSLAYVGLAETLLNDIALSRAPLEDVSVKVEPLINRALSLTPNLPDALATKGWLLTEQYKLGEALPLLQKAIALNPNDAPSHRYLGLLFDRRADPNSALSHFSTAASLDPLDFISHVFRCQELIDLGELEAADAACSRARTLDTNNLWGPLATSWIARARGNTAQAIQWVDAARKIAPTDEYLAEQMLDLLLTQGRIADARALLRSLPRQNSLFAHAREANIVLAEGGPAALKKWLIDNDVAKTAFTSGEFAELARLQYLADDAAVARSTLAHAQRILPMTSADLFDGSQIRHDYSAALYQAGIELKGGGDARRAKQLLEQLDQMLAAYEKNGGRHFGAKSLRAASLAMQGKTAEAQAALQEAWQQGWRTTWRARTDPFLSAVKMPR
ncbi:MAG TPA: winged helix-turn-helix domain-containing protein [Steroidobacteraceae bacterium]|nr:winged helix-turn-helix domain-containing protein [Steroidobacteraceae bacterium]